MTFTFTTSPQTTNEKLLALIRQRIGDTVSSDGPRRNNENFTDEEILLAYAAEGNHRERTSARLLEILAAEWSKRTGSETLAAIQEANQQAYAFRQNAADIRRKWGFGADEDMLDAVGGEMIQIKMSKNV